MSSFQNLYATHSTSLFPVRRMSTIEINENIDRGLCCNCDQIWSNTHRCRSKYLILLCDDEDDEIGDPRSMAEDEVSSEDLSNSHTLDCESPPQPTAGTPPPFPSLPIPSSILPPLLPLFASPIIDILPNPTEILDSPAFPNQPSSTLVADLQAATPQMGVSMLIEVSEAQLGEVVVDSPIGLGWITKASPIKLVPPQIQFQHLPQCISPSSPIPPHKFHTIHFHVDRLSPSEVKRNCHGGICYSWDRKWSKYLLHMGSENGDDSEPPDPLTDRRSPSNVKQNRDSGICYICNRKWSSIHRCHSKYLLLMWSDDDPDQPNSPSLAVGEEETMDCVSNVGLLGYNSCSDHHLGSSNRVVIALARLLERPKIDSPISEPSPILILLKSPPLVLSAFNLNSAILQSTQPIERLSPIELGEMKKRRLYYKGDQRSPLILRGPSHCLGLVGTRMGCDSELPEQSLHRIVDTTSMGLSVNPLAFMSSFVPRLLQVAVSIYSYQIQLIILRQPPPKPPELQLNPNVHTLTICAELFVVGSIVQQCIEPLQEFWECTLNTLPRPARSCVLPCLFLCRSSTGNSSNSGGSGCLGICWLLFSLSFYQACSGQFWWERSCVVFAITYGPNFIL